MGGDHVAVSGVGTLRWAIDDENGVKHIFMIPGSLYIPDSPARLFSPQHWAQERKDNTPIRDGTWQATFADHVLLVWGQQKYRKKITFDKSNVATFTTSAGCRDFRTFRACLDAQGAEETEEGTEECFTAFDATLIVDDEDDDLKDDDETEENEEDDQSIIPVTTQHPTSHEKGNDKDEPGYSIGTGHHDTSYDTYQNVVTIEDVEEDSFEGKLKPSSEILLWHYRLGHIPFSRLQTMARKGCCQSDSQIAGYPNARHACMEK